jgi:DnaJ-class molecular chaperone
MECPNCNGTGDNYGVECEICHGHGYFYEQD